MSDNDTSRYSPNDQQEIWRSFVSEPGIGIGVITVGGRILYANEQAARLYDQPLPGELIGKSFFEVFPKDWAEERLALFRRVIETGKPMTLRAIWNGRQIRSTIRPIAPTEGDSDEAQVLIISRFGPPDASETGDVVEAEIVHFGDLDVLTPKEIEVLALLGQGMRLKDIADTLHRSPKTIDNHRSSIGRKLNLADRVELAHLASLAGLQLNDAARTRVDLPPPSE